MAIGTTSNRDTPRVVKKVFISQSNYIPWKGYFDAISMADEFVIYDDVQYTRRDWRNRNRIKTRDGLLWLTIPIRTESGFDQKICATRTAGSHWKRKHMKSIILNYRRSRYFDAYWESIEQLYREVDTDLLSEINYSFLKGICEILGIETTFRWSTEFQLPNGRTERVVELCRQVNASTIINGPSARYHLEERLFDEAGIDVEYMDYSGYRPYPQAYGPFEHRVSIIDAILNVGGNAREFMRSFP